MAFFDSIKEAITQKPANLKRPYFYKIDSDALRQLEQLKEIYKNAPNSIKPKIDQDIRMLSYGIDGEKNIAFELSNSLLPIIVLHDLHFEFEDLSTQIDYLIITNKFSLIIECKNLIGNIEVNNNGDFIRTWKYNGKYNKEGIYSPITQNSRHLDMIKRIKLSNKNNFVTKSLFEKYFDEFHKSLVVLANPKTVINMKYAKKDVKDKIIRCDQLTEYIKNMINGSKNAPYSENEMYELANFYLSLHTPNTVDYTKKYQTDEAAQEKPIQTVTPTVAVPTSAPVANPIASSAKANIEETPLYKALKQYRYYTSKAEGIKPYLIYNNAQMEELISIMPETLEEIKQVSGFGDVKCQKYGTAILEIIKQYK